MNLYTVGPEFKDLDNTKAFSLGSTHVFSIPITASDLLYQEDYTKILSAPELAKAARFIRPADNRRYLVCRFVLRNLLSGYLGIHPSEIPFEVKANKKPMVKGLEFNVSHSGDQILIAIGPEPIGIDMETIQPDFDFEPLLSDFFTKEEREQIDVHPMDALLGFYTLWTRKEALLKATGEGLTDDMQTINSLTEKVCRNGYSYTVQSFFQHKQYIWSIAMLNATIPLCCWNYRLL